MRWIRGLLVVALLVAVGFALSPEGRRLAEAVGLLADVWTIGRGPAAPDPGMLRTMAYDGPAGRRRDADLYCDPAHPPGARLLLVHGLVEAGRHDARLRALGGALARHRFLVMVPDFPGMRALRAGRQDIAEVGAALEALHGLGDCRGGGGRRPLQIGVVGFSYSAGPVLLALDQSSRRADFAVLFGGYYDLAEVILFLTTGRHRDAGRDEEGEMLPEGRWLLLEANAGTIAEPDDRDTLVAIARRRRADPHAGIGDLVSGLRPPARAILDLMANTDPARFEMLLARTGPSLQDLLADLSPSRSLSRPLETDLLLLHGRSDVIIPYTQSLKLAREVRVRGRIRLAILGGFRHARPDDAGARRWWSTAVRYPADSLRLLLFLEDLLARRTAPTLTADRPDRSSWRRRETKRGEHAG